MNGIESSQRLSLVNNVERIQIYIRSLLIDLSIYKLAALLRLANKQTPFASLFTYLLYNQTTNQA